MTRGALAFIAGLGTGYLNQKNREEEKARQDKFDQIALDRAADEKADRERKKKTVSEIGEASQEVRAVEIQDHSISSPTSDTRTDVIATPPIAAQGIAANQESPQSTGSLPIASQGIAASQSKSLPTSAPPISSQGIAPSPESIKSPAASAQVIAAQGVPKSTWQVGKQSFTDQDSANKAAQEFNKPEARNARVAQVYRSNGDPATALELEAKSKQADLADLQMKMHKHNWAKQLENEGIEDVAKAVAIGDVDGALKAMNSNGKKKAQNLTLTPVDTKLADGTLRRTYIAKYELIKEDGSIQPMQTASEDLQKAALSVKEAMSIDIEKDVKAYMRKHQQDVLNQNDRHHRENINLQREREKRQTIGGQLQEKERLLGRSLSQEERSNMFGIDTMPQAVKMQVASLLKEQEQISQALNKAQAEGTFVETDKDGKPNPLMVRSASLNMQLGQLLNYKNKTNDPLGIMQVNPQGKAIAPQGNAAAPSQSGAIIQTPASLFSTGKAVAVPALDGIDLRADPVLSTLKQQLSTLDANDPANVQQIMALGKAKNDRIQQLQEKHGRLTKLIVE
jgi:hypothetical protein